jgi:hypothetical protein
MATFLETSRLELRPIEDKYLADMVGTAHSEGARLYGAFHHPTTEKDMKEWVNSDYTLLASENSAQEKPKGLCVDL